jgi:hypothetical protein
LHGPVLHARNREGTHLPCVNVKRIVSHSLLKN